jgi:PIN domain nuclease of toxin-antitoxin system
VEQSKRITIDAHSLIWYLHEDSNVKLSKIAFDAIHEAVSFGTVYVPIIALLEILWLIENGKYPILFESLKDILKRNVAFEIVPLTYALMELSEGLKSVELHDRVIIATAIMTGTSLVTKDLIISKVYDRVIW